MTEPASAPSGLASPSRATPMIAVLHGVNLDQLGRRDPVHYGRITLPELEARITGFAVELTPPVELDPFQTNDEGAFVTRLHRLAAPDGGCAGLILNPGAWTHYSYAIRDALELAALPAVEVHLSDVDARESFRRVSVISDLCLARIKGRGPEGYRDALRILHDHLLGAPPR